MPSTEDPAQPALFLKGIFAFLALPGLVAFVVPLVVLRPKPARAPALDAVFPLLVGCVALLWCVRDFYVAGRGTLAPWSPPRRLVQTGLYRRSRNPMYVGVLLILVGWALAYRSMTLALYAMAFVVGFHLRVVLFEEPWLARTHGGAWDEYRKRVPRWLW